MKMIPFLLLLALATPALAADKFTITSHFTSLYRLSAAIRSDAIEVNAYNCQAKVAYIIAFDTFGQAIYLNYARTRITKPNHQWTVWTTPINSFHQITAFQIVLDSFQPVGDCRLEVEPYEY